MKPLKTYRMVLTELCMCPSEKNESQRHKQFRNLLNVMLFINIVTYSVSSAVFILKSDNLEDKFNALFQIMSCLTIMYSFIVMILIRGKVGVVFENLTAFSDECKTVIFYELTLYLG